MGNTIAKSKLQCPGCSQPMAPRSQSCIKCRRAEQKANATYEKDRRDSCACGRPKMPDSKVCRACQMHRIHLANKRSIGLRSQAAAPPADGHRHFFELASPNGATQTSRCTDHRAEGIKGCGKEKTFSNVIDGNLGFTDTLPPLNQGVDNRIELYYALNVTGLYP